MTAYLVVAAMLSISTLRAETLTMTTVTAPHDILAACQPLRPSLGGHLDPAAVRQRLGATHCAGRYNFTEEPYVVEGARAIAERLGYRHLKLWFYECDRVYSQNHTWTPETTLVDLAKNPAFVKAFAFPFDTITLEVRFSPAGERHPRPPGHTVAPDLDLVHEEQELYDLACHLLTTYRDRKVTFILQNWEGDWMFRDFCGAPWNQGKVPADVPQRVETMVAWFAARQRAVDRARQDHPGSRCQVLHAIEVNRVFDLLINVPTVTSRILPRVEVDLISWSCYDGMQIDAHGTGDGAAIGIWQGMDLIRAHARTRLKDRQGRPAVMLGEFGIAEQKQLIGKRSAADILEGTVAAAIAQDAYLLLYWEVYCNEPNDPRKKDAHLTRNLEADELNGFWLIRPDGSLSGAATWFAQVMPQPQVHSARH